MNFKGILKPEFWDAESEKLGPYKRLFDYKRLWRLCFTILGLVSLVPLIILAFIDFNVTRGAIKSENMLRAARTTSNARSAVSSFLDERKSALELILQLHDRRNFPEAIPTNNELEITLKSLKQAFGGFIDLGIVDQSGKQLRYVGPYNLEGRSYNGQPWFNETVEKGSYISDVFLGFRDSPHIVIAIKHFMDPDKKKFRIYRATLDTTKFNSIIASMTLSHEEDAFLVNTHGVIQTPTKWNGDVLNKINFDLPQYSFKTKIEEINLKDGFPAIVGHANITGTPFILLFVKPEADLMAAWESTRDTITWLTTISIAIILIVLWAVASYLVERIYIADMTRSKALQQMEHHNRMASIGRLAAGVAHEINNPLAIINEKAGLLKDIFTFTEKYKADAKILGLVDSVLNSVERCGKITKRLLGFSRQNDIEFRPVYPAKILETVLSFLNKEAEYRSIDVNVKIDSGIYEIVTDRGKLEQVLLNLISNAFQAMKDGGSLLVCVSKIDKQTVQFSVKDDGCGIPEADLKKIFEPFYSTKKQTGGTGLGLSITYGLVQDLGGAMSVKSELGKGTEFIFTLPITIPKG